MNTQRSSIRALAGPALGMFRTIGDAAAIQYDAEPGETRFERLDYQILLKCFRRIKRWRIPTHWSRREWHEEMEAEAIVAALQAARDFDPDRGVPWPAFLYQRIIRTGLAHYRREWMYSLRQRPTESIGDQGVKDGDRTATHEPALFVLLELLDRLSRTDRSLIEAIYWEGKSQGHVAQRMGITQQAVSKRKLSILRCLRAPIEKAAAARSKG